jgi:hypothetical protein
MSDYFSSLGDDRLKEDINNKIQAYVEEIGISSDDILSQLNPTGNGDVIDNEDIMAQAEAELNAEQS